MDHSSNEEDPGSNFLFNITVTEIDPSNVFVNYNHGDLSYNISLKRSPTGFWWKIIKLDDRSGEMEYTIHVADEYGRFNTSSVQTVKVGDSYGWELVGTIVTYGFLINTIFAAFNLLPIRFLGLDGYKIADWNFVVYGTFVGVTALFISLTAFGTTMATVYALICIGVALWRRFG